MKPQKPDRPDRPRRRRVEPRELLRRRGVIFESEVQRWLEEGRLYVFRDATGEPRAFYLDEKLLEGPPWWARRRSGVDAGDARREGAARQARRLVSEA